MSIFMAGRASSSVRVRRPHLLDLAHLAALMIARAMDGYTLCVEIPAIVGPALTTPPAKFTVVCRSLYWFKILFGRWTNTLPERWTQI
jgi:hypothetical protein